MTIEVRDLEVFVAPGRWAVLEIDGADLAPGQLSLFCSIGDHKDLGMQALVQVA